MASTAENKSRRSAMAVIFFTVFIDLVGFGIIIPLSPYLAVEFKATPFQVGLLMSVFSLAQFIFSPLWGRISDRVGRRPILLMSLLGSTLSYLWFAFAKDLTGLFLARTFAGIFGASISTAMAYIADITPERDRSKGMGLIGAAFGMGFIFGPFIGAVSGSWGQSLGAQPPFGMSFASIVAATICLLNFLFALKALQESLPPEQRGQVKPRDSRFKLIFQHITRPVVGPLMAVLFLSTLSMAHMESTLFLYVKDQFDWGLRLAGYGFAYVGIMMAFTQGFLIRRMMPKWGERKTLFAGLLVAAVGMTGIAFSNQVMVLALVVTLLALGNGMTHPSVLGGISLQTSSEEQGIVMGVGQSLSALGRIIGPALGGWLYGRVSIQAPFLVAGLLMALAFLVVLFIFAQIPQAGKVKEA